MLSFCVLNNDSRRYHSQRQLSISVTHCGESHKQDAIAKEEDEDQSFLLMRKGQNGKHHDREDLVHRLCRHEQLRADTEKGKGWSCSLTDSGSNRRKCELVEGQKSLDLEKCLMFFSPEFLSVFSSTSQKQIVWILFRG